MERLFKSVAAFKLMMLLECVLGVLCLTTPCLNGATCMETNNTRTCVCVPGTTGQDCETGNL